MFWLKALQLHKVDPPFKVSLLFQLQLVSPQLLVPIATSPLKLVQFMKKPTRLTMTLVVQLLVVVYLDLVF